MVAAALLENVLPKFPIFEIHDQIFTPANFKTALKVIQTWHTPQSTEKSASLYYYKESFRLPSSGIQMKS